MFAKHETAIWFPELVRRYISALINLSMDLSRIIQHIPKVWTTISFIKMDRLIPFLFCFSCFSFAMVVRSSGWKYIDYIYIYIYIYIAYTEGVVIGICKGCKSKHLIADNLGTAGLDGDTNIENYFKARGMEDNVNRVTQEVFELEKILGFDSIGGALAGEDGTPVLE